MLLLLLVPRMLAVLASIATAGDAVKAHAVRALLRLGYDSVQAHAGKEMLRFS